MANLAPNQQIVLGPFPKGAVLTFTAPKSDSISVCPTVNGTLIMLKSVPKKITLAAGNPYTIVAGSKALTYNVTQLIIETLIP